MKKLQALKKRVATLTKQTKAISDLRWEAIRLRDQETKSRQKVIDRLERAEISKLGILHKAREKLRIAVAKVEDSK